MPNEKNIGLTRENLKKLSQEVLDDLVIDVKSDEAAEINNQGREAQIDFLVGEPEDISPHDALSSFSELGMGPGADRK